MAQTVESIDPNNERVDASSVEIERLIEQLDGSHYAESHGALERLELIGPPAVDALIQALHHPHRQVRWGAAKALGEIQDASSAPALVQALEDRESDVRWLAAEALIALRRDALEPLLEALIERSDSIWLREGSHHVLHALSRPAGGVPLATLMGALEGVEPTLEVPRAAKAVLDVL
jgi:HEAT repeat protein